MTPRERVLAAFAHEEPDRVPIWCGMSAEFQARAEAELGETEEGLRRRFGDDFRRVFATYVGPDVALRHEGATYRTPFGIERHGLGYGQPFEHPLANATLNEIHDYAWPDPNTMDVSGVAAAAQVWNGHNAILGGDWSPFWHDAIDLLGMETLCLRMYDDPELVDALLEHLVDYYFNVSLRLFEAAAKDIDIFFIGNDFGSQTGPLISTAMFDRFILPHLRRLTVLGHSYGLPVQLHCCGGFAPLIPSMIKARIDALHAIQPSCAGMELRGLKEHFGDQIVFNGAIDSQHVLITGTPESVRRDTRAVLDSMAPGGGYVAGASHDSILEETPVANVLAMFDTVRDYQLPQG